MAIPLRPVITASGAAGTSASLVSSAYAEEGDEWYSFLGEVAHGQQKGGGTTFAINCASTVPAGRLLVAILATDNFSTAAGDTTSHTVSDSQGNTWTRIKEYNADGWTISGNGITCSVWRCSVANPLTTSDTIDAELSGGAGGDAMVFTVAEFVGGVPLLSSSNAAAVGSGGTVNITHTRPGGREYLWVGMMAAENAVTPSVDGDYSALSGANTSGGVADTNIGMRSGYRVADLTTDTYTGSSGAGGIGNGILVAIEADGPTAAFTFDIVGLSVDFTDASTAGAAALTDWFWDFGDGTTSTAQNPTHEYASAGFYTVTLTVTDANSLQGTSTGAAPLADPTDISDCVIWLDARDLVGVVSDGANVSTWANNATAGDATQATGANQPVFRETGGAAGGPYVEFVSGSDYMRIAHGADVTFRQELFWYLVVKYPTFNGQSPMSKGTNSAIFYTTGSQWMFERPFVQGGSARTSIAANTWGAHGVRVLGASAPRTVQHFLNGVATGTTFTLNDGGSSTGDFLLGSYNGSRIGNMHLSAALAYDRPLTNDEIAGLQVWAEFHHLT